MRRFIFPVPPGILLVIAAGVALLTFFHAQNLMSWAYADWVAVSAEARQTLGLAGPLAAAGSAWTAARFIGGYNNIFTPPLARRGTVALVVTQTAVMGVWAGIGLLIGLAPAMVNTALRATWGSPDALVILSGIVALWFFIALGYLVGVVLPLLAAIPAAAGLGYAISVFYSVSTGSLTAVMYPFGVVAGYEEPFGTSVIRIVFFAACVAFVSGASIALVGQPAVVRPPGVVAQAAFLILMVPLLAYGLNSQHVPLIRHAEATDPACDTADGVTACVHPARADMLSPLLRASVRVKAAIGAAYPYTSVVDSALWRTPADDQISLQLQEQRPDSWQSIAITDMALTASGMQQCITQQPSANDNTSDRHDPAVVSQALALWITHQAHVRDRFLAPQPGAEELARQMDHRPAEDIRSRLRQTLPTVQSCQGKPADLGS